MTVDQINSVLDYFPNYDVGDNRAKHKAFSYKQLIYITKHQKNE